jgi:hypothetical protein
MTSRHKTKAMPEPTADRTRRARENANLTQAQAAELVYLARLLDSLEIQPRPEATMNAKQHYATVKTLKAAIARARTRARNEAMSYGCPISRNPYISVFDRKGKVIAGQGQSWKFDGTAAQLRELEQLLHHDARVASIEIEGEFDGTDGELLSEWSVTFGQSAEEVRRMRGIAQEIARSGGRDYGRP